MPGPAENVAIFDAEAPARILAAARDTLDWGIAWCCGTEGMHPHDVIRLRPGNLDSQGFLRWSRAKNAHPRSALISATDLPRMREFLELMRRKAPTRQTIHARARALTERAGYAGGPRVLRKTAILADLRRYLAEPSPRPDMMDLVAARAGCKRDTVAMYYLDLRSWEAAGR